MILDVHERLALINMLPKEEDYKALKTARRAREMLTFTPEEMKTLNMVNDPSTQRVTWDTDKVSEVVKDCPIDEYTTNLFRDELAKLNDKHQLTEQTMSIYEKFVVMYK